MYKRGVTCAGKDVSVYTNSDAVVQVIEEDAYLRHLLPSFRVSDATSKREIILEDCSYASYKREQSSVRVSGRLKHSNNAQIAYLLRHAMQYHLLRENILLIEGGGIADITGAAALFGPSKTGKTSLVKKMVECGWRAYGDDQLAIDVSDVATLISGNTHFSTEERLHNTEDSIYSYEDASNQPWYAKKPSQLEKIVFLEPDIRGTNKSKRLNSKKGQIRLYGYLGTELRSGSYCLLNSDLPFPVNISGENLRRLLQKIKSWKVQYYTVSGNLEQRVFALQSALDDD